MADIKTTRRVSFGIAEIRAQRRITLDPNLLENAGLQIGSQVEMFLDVDNEEIVLQKINSREPMFSSKAQRRKSTK